MWPLQPHSCAFPRIRGCPWLWQQKVYTFYLFFHRSLHGFSFEEKNLICISTSKELLSHFTAPSLTSNIMPLNCQFERWKRKKSMHCSHLHFKSLCAWALLICDSSVQMPPFVVAKHILHAEDVTIFFMCCRSFQYTPCLLTSEGKWKLDLTTISSNELNSQLNDKDYWIRVNTKCTNGRHMWNIKAVWQEL